MALKCSRASYWLLLQLLAMNPGTPSSPAPTSTQTVRRTTAADAGTAASPRPARSAIQHRVMKLSTNLEALLRTQKNVHRNSGRAPSRTRVACVAASTLQVRDCSDSDNPRRSSTCSGKTRSAHTRAAADAHLQTDPVRIRASWTRIRQCKAPRSTAYGRRTVRDSSSSESAHGDVVPAGSGWLGRLRIACCMRDRSGQYVRV